MKTFLVIVISVIVSFNAYANSNWIYIATNTSNDEFFIDKNSMQKSGDSITFWQKLNYGQRDKHGDLSLKAQQTINCRTREIILRYSIFYDDINNTGKMTDSVAAKDSWSPIAPDSVNWALLKFVCK